MRGERERGGGGERVCIANRAFYCLMVFLLRQACTWLLRYPLATFAYICPRFRVSGCMLSFDERHEVSVCLGLLLTLGLGELLLFLCLRSRVRETL